MFPMPVGGKKRVWKGPQKKSVGEGVILDALVGEEVRWHAISDEILQDADHLLVCCRQTGRSDESALAASCSAFFAHFAPPFLFLPAACWACGKHGKES